MSAWSWSGPLWRAGILEPSIAGASISDELPGVRALIAADPRFASLRAATTPAASKNDRSDAERLCRDLTRSLTGGDPTIAVPVAAATERFAGRMGWPLIRGESSSILARHESRAARPSLRFTLTIPNRPTAGLILTLRRDLHEPLGQLAFAIESLSHAVLAGDPSPDIRHVQTTELAPALRCYESALDFWIAANPPAPDDESPSPRLIRAAVAGAAIPPGSALYAAAAALRQVVPDRIRREALLPEQGETSALTQSRITVLTVRESPWDA